MSNYESIRTRLYADLKHKFNRSDTEIVKDAISEAFVIVLSKQPPDEVMQNEHKFYAWHYKIAYRYMIDSVNEKHREVPIEDDDAFAAETEFADRLADRETSIQCLCCLSVPEREAVVLHKMLAYSVDEVACICHISRNSVKDRLKRGMSHLRGFLPPPLKCG